jgi:hypothetical protein
MNTVFRKEYFGIKKLRGKEIILNHLYSKVMNYQLKETQREKCGLYQSIILRQAKQILKCCMETLEMEILKCFSEEKR